MVIALLTDFGTVDAYVGVMKGVILSITPSAQIVDLTHAVQPQNVRQAAFLLMNNYAYFPAETIFVVVVDPGVGSTRRAVAVRAGQYTFVAPDNGVLSYALGALNVYEAVELTNSAYQLSTLSASFHGRDIFAPAAAHLAAGVALNDFGSPVPDLVRLSPPLLEMGERELVGEVLHIDYYGNLVTSIGNLEWLAADQLILKPRFLEAGERTYLNTASATVQIGSHRIHGVHRSFSAVELGDLLAMVGSSGALEIATNHGNAAAQLGVSLGDQVVLRIE